MTSSFFFLQAEKNQKNHAFIEAVEAVCNESKQQAYLLNKPLGDNKYSYDFNDGMVLLLPKHKIIFVNFSTDMDAFASYKDDFIEDIGSISDKYMLICSPS